jgi:hypothetical protein
MNGDLMAGRDPKKGISRHLERNAKDDFKGEFKGGIAGEYATPSKIGRHESKYFGEGGNSPLKKCPTTHKDFKNFATIAPSDTELEYYCPFCDSLIAREFNDEASMRKIEIYDWEHTAE